ncbi:MAG: S-adenosylmethionine:tRNA ribosyltransferase-isomerase, partial [Bacteriovoracaceae bacterium]|nr:S-adenosylmethionine:tRNA ribosyltransferase-isomerase [Bacteriovoracaceae bacterium]
MTAAIDYLRSSYRYDLPPALIAQYPAQPRDHSRLLVYHQKTDEVEHRYFYELPQILSATTLLIMNNSKVFPARLFGRRQTLGRGHAEMLVLSLQPLTHQPVPVYPVLLKSSRAKKVGDVFVFAEVPSSKAPPLLAEIKTIEEDGSFGVAFSRPPEEWIDRLGKIPLPAYIRQGRAEAADTISYQTIYAADQEKGSVAAPTAGLHFTPQVLAALKARGMETSFVSLHVGPGTFVPVKCDDIRQHQMHREYFTLPAPTAQLWQTARQQQRPIVAVGTTTLRTLQAMLDEQGQLRQDQVGRLNSTDIFLYPGKKIYGIN